MYIYNTFLSNLTFTLTPPPPLLSLYHVSLPISCTRLFFRDRVSLCSWLRTHYIDKAGSQSKVTLPKEALFLPQQPSIANSSLAMGGALWAPPLLTLKIWLSWSRAALVYTATATVILINYNPVMLRKHGFAAGLLNLWLLQSSCHLFHNDVSQKNYHL